jgi:hypothetical protein
MDIRFCQSALARQFPQLDLTGFRPLGEGGVFQVFETDNGLAWRFLKRITPPRSRTAIYGPSISCSTRSAMS